jgi:hypothetical protein
MIKPLIDEKTGKQLPFAQQPREYRIADMAGAVANFTAIDHSDLTPDQKVDWYVSHCCAAYTREEQAEIAEKALLRLLAE